MHRKLNKLNYMKFLKDKFTIINNGKVMLFLAAILLIFYASLYKL